MELFTFRTFRKITLKTHSLDFLVQFAAWFDLNSYSWQVLQLMRTIALDILEWAHLNNHNTEKNPNQIHLILIISSNQFNYKTFNHFLLAILLESTFFYLVYFNWSYLSSVLISVSLFSYYNSSPTLNQKIYAVLLHLNLSHTFSSSIFPLSLQIALEIITSRIFYTLNFNVRKCNLFFKIIIKYSFLMKPTGPMNNAII